MQAVKKHDVLPVIMLLREEFPLTDPQCRLLAASLKAFSKKGYSSTSVSTIVSIARTSKTTFYKYYKNKEAILIHLFELMSAALIRKVEETLVHSPLTSERTYQAIKTYIESCFAYREVAKLLLVDTVGLVPSLEKKRLAVIEHFASIFQRELSSLPHHHSLSEEQWILSYAMVGAINQLVIQSFMVHQPPSAEQLARVLEKMMSKLLREGAET